MRFALFPFGSRGDVQPIVALGRTLRKQGHDVVLGTAPTFADVAEDAGLAFHPTGGDFEGWMRTRGEALSDKPLALMRELGAYIERDVPQSFADTAAAARGADLIVSASLQQTAPSIAEHLGIPFRSLIYCPQVVPSSSWPPLNVRQTSLPGFVNRLAWGAVAFAMNRMVRSPINRARAALGLAPVDDAVAHLRSAAPIVCADAPLCGPLPDDAGGATMTGGLVVDHASPLAADVEAFLGGGPPPLYVGFGSMAAKDPARGTALVVDVARRLQTRLILAAGWGGFVAPPATDDVLFIQGAPHTRLFPRCRFVVHHGGAGTTTAAARAGVPQLVVAHTADQYWWGDRVRDRGVGPARVDRSKLTAEVLHARLATALEDEGMAARARRLAEELAPIDGNALTAAALVDAAGLRDASAPLRSGA